MLIFERAEGPLAVVETESGSLLDFPLAALPEGVRAGDLIRFGAAPESACSCRLKLLSAANGSVRARNAAGLRLKLPAAALPPEAVPGTELTLWVDSEATAARRAEIRKLENSLRAD